jgi:hypothetical protein
MEQVEVLVMEKIVNDEHDNSSDDEVTCAVFAWVCNVIEVRSPHTRENGCLIMVS